MTDKSSRPHTSPTRCSTRLERRIIKLRFCRQWGPHRISYRLGVPRSTVGRVLARYRMPLLAHLDQATGLPVRRSKAVRYEASVPGELVHAPRVCLVAEISEDDDVRHLSDPAESLDRARDERLAMHLAAKESVEQDPRLVERQGFAGFDDRHRVREAAGLHLKAHAMLGI